MRRLTTLAVAVLIVSLPACSGVPATSTAGPSSTVQELGLSDLSGTWENGRVILQVNDAGDYLVLGSDQDDEDVLMSGFVARDDRDFVFVTGVGGECPGQTGVYSASITGGILTLTVVEDPCRSRSSGFAEPLSLQTG